MPYRLPWLSLLPLPLLLWGRPGLAVEFEFEPKQPGLEIGKPLLEKKAAPGELRQRRVHRVKQNAADSQEILQVEGTLTDSDPTLDDGSHYDEHFFVGQSGQIVKITLESDEFDTYLLLESPAGERIATNDDSSDGTNAQIVVQLLESGQYRVLVNALDETGQGAYKLVVNPATMADLRIAEQKAEADRLLDEGIAQYNRSEWQQALAAWQQALEIFREIGDRAGEAKTLNNIGVVYEKLGKYPEAIAQYEASLAIKRELGDRAGEANTLGNIGSVNVSLNRDDQALTYYQQSQAIREEIGDYAGQALSLWGIALIYQRSGDSANAIAIYQQGLAISRDVGAQAEEASILTRLGEIFESLEQPELAIVFLKQAINTYESIRDSNQALEQSLQDSYTATIADNYRTLADLLLQQNRILEAQRVLDLLRVQELDDYLRGVQRNATTEAGVAYWQVETKLLQLYKELLLAGNELALLRDIPFSELNPEQRQRLEALTAREGELEENFQQWLEHPEVAATLAALRTSTEGNNLEIEDYATLQQNLANLPQNTVLLYPLILDQRLELVLVSPHAPPVRHPVEVEAAELNRVITAFGQSLKYARPDIEIHAQQLYDWLIKPLEDNLSDAQAEMIIFAPDGVLRYVPLAALHDGDGWLAERFSFTHITAAALTNFAAKPQDNPRLLAAACGECDFEYEVAGQQFRFSLLPYAESEVVRLSEQMPNVDVLPTADFTPEALNLRLGSYEILHLATHGAFVSGQPEESFIVFGDESRLNLTQIEQQWKLPNADLVVLSACETAVGSDELGTGVEILGLGFQIQQAGAKATLASLWPVSDGGTQVLMTAFYSALAAGKTKAEALQLAQLALITGNSDAVGLPRGGFVLDDIPDEVVSGLAHPHYWAPFILIGNGL